jgi:hypothetical protein
MPHPSYPQSWNRYAYVFNAPLSFVDPLGLCGGQGEYPDLPCPTDTSVTVTATEDPCPSGTFPATIAIAGGSQTLCLGFGDNTDNIQMQINYGMSQSQGGGNTSGSTTAQACVQPTAFQKLGIAAQAAAAKVSNKTIEVGLGGSAAAGRILGVAYIYSRQLVVSPNGQAAFTTTFTPLSGLPFNALVSPGAGGYGGFQFSVSNAKTPQDLAAQFLNGGIGGGRGFGGGADLAIGTGTQGQFVYQFTTTIGGGASLPGIIGQGGSFTFTAVTPICSD